jgi:hypothetical protein
MKSLATSAVLLLSPVMVARSCTIVSKVEPSSQNARITVMMDGNPQKDVKVVVSTVEGQARLTITTDSQGVVSLLDLPPGKYCLAASAAPTLRADDLCLEVSTDEDRRFTAQMAPGIYIAVFRSFGFQTEFVPFEIAKEGSKEDLRVKLMIASMGCS